MGKYRVRFYECKLGIKALRDGKGGFMVIVRRDRSGDSGGDIGWTPPLGYPDEIKRYIVEKARNIQGARFCMGLIVENEQNKRIVFSVPLPIDGKLAVG